MITDEIKKLLTDICDSINSIDEHLDFERNFDSYLNSKTKRRAVEREIEIIGEAINKILKKYPSISISYARIIVDLRNRVIHAYDTVDDIIIWKVIIKDLPILLMEVKKLLNEN